VNTTALLFAVVTAVAFAVLLWISTHLRDQRQANALEAVALMCVSASVTVIALMVLDAYPGRWWVG
jgi:hypothetical protein